MTEVERRGDAVHRTAGPWTDTVHALLAHVRANGLAWAPEPRGRDPQGREVIAYLEGDVPAYPLPAWVWEDAVLDGAARLLRDYHDATAGFPRAGRTWQLPAHPPEEVICHNDFAPYNLVFRAGRPYAAIDFDTASPGSRAWDLAYLAYRLVPFTAPANPDGRASAPPVRARRLARLCAAYGAVEPAAVEALVPARLRELAAHHATPPAHAAFYRADAAALASPPRWTDPSA